MRHPKLKPLLLDLKSLGIGEYLASNEYSRLLIKNKLEDGWQKVFDDVESKRNYMALGVNHALGDSEKAFETILNAGFDINDKLFFNDFTFITIKGFINWKKINLIQFSPVKEDLELIGFPKQEILKLVEALFPSEELQIDKQSEEKSKDLKNIEVTEAKIFISHSSKDILIVESFVEKILRLSLNISPEHIFCTSIEGLGIMTGDDFRDKIKNEITNAEVVILILSLSYKESEICLNEMGAAWVLNKKVIPIILPPLEYREVGALHITNQIARIDVANGIDNIIHSLQSKLNLKPIDVRVLNKHRDEFIDLFKKGKLVSQSTNVIEQIKEQFNVKDNNVATLLWHLGTYDGKFRNQTTLIKRTALSESQLDDLIKLHPDLFYRGKGKTGNVIYRLQDAIKTKFISFRGSDINKIIVLAAKYTWNGGNVDVTSKVRQLISEGIDTIIVDPSVFGIRDPAPRIQKTLKINFKINGKEKELIHIDGDRFRIE